MTNGEDPPAPIAPPTTTQPAGSVVADGAVPGSTTVSLIVGTILGLLTGVLFGLEVGVAAWLVGVFGTQLILCAPTSGQPEPAMPQTAPLSPPPTPSRELQYAGLGWTVVRIVAGALQLTIAVIVMNEYMRQSGRPSGADHGFFGLVIACLGTSFLATVGPWATRPTTFLGLWFARRAAEERLKLAALNAATQAAAEKGARPPAEPPAG